MMKIKHIYFLAPAILLIGCANNYAYKIADDKYKMECRESMAACEDEARKVCSGPFTFEDKQERKQTLFMQDGSSRETMIYNVIIKCN